MAQRFEPSQYWKTVSNTCLRFISKRCLVMSRVSLPALHLRGSYLKSTLFCEGGKLLLSEKLVKLPALPSPPTS